MSTPDNTYRLVIFDRPDDLPAVRDLLCSVTGDHPTDAAQWVARTPGIWPRPLAEGEVRELLDGLYEFGVAAEAWRIDKIPVLFPPRTVHTAACLPEGLRIQGLRGEPLHWVPWDKVELVASGRISQNDEFREVTPPSWVSAVSSGLNAMIGRPLAAARRRRAMRIPRDPVGEVFIVRKDPRIAFRVAENAMNYSYLGDRLRSSASENFPLFLADVCTRSDDAYITPSTQSVLGNGEPGDCEFPSSGALLDYATHRLLWSWYRKDRDSGQRTQAEP
jgi:hypothetical protein